MSHVSLIQVDHFKWDHATIGAMCAFEKWEIVQKKTYVWYGRHVGDYPIPEGFSYVDMGRCDYAIRIPGATYELGVIERNGKVHIMWDFWSSGGLQEVLGRNAEKLKAAYTKAKVALAAAKARRKMITRTQRLNDGSAWTVFRVMA